MDIWQVVAGTTAVGLLIYLLAALFWPDHFS